MKGLRIGPWSTGSQRWPSQPSVRPPLQQLVIQAPYIIFLFHSGVCSLCEHCQYFNTSGIACPIRVYDPLAMTHADVLGVRAGQRLMRNRKPFNMKMFSILHNTVMFLLSLYMVIETMTQVIPELKESSNQQCARGINLTTYLCMPPFGCSPSATPDAPHDASIVFAADEQCLG